MGCFDTKFRYGFTLTSEEFQEPCNIIIDLHVKFSILIDWSVNWKVLVKMPHEAIRLPSPPAVFVLNHIVLKDNRESGPGLHRLRQLIL